MNDKLGKLRNSMKKAGLEAALITSEINQLYMTGFGFSGYILVCPSVAYIITDPRYSEAARAALGDRYSVIVPEADRVSLVKKLLAENGVKALAYEDHELTCAAFSGFKSSYPETEFIPLGILLPELREIKDETELSNIAAAQSIADAAFEHVLKHMTPDMTETELAVEIEYFMLKNGAKEKSFDTICVSGSASSLPHGVPRNKKLERGFLTMDFGAKIYGYCSDMTRTVVIGRADSEMRRVYATVLAAQEAALAAVAKGALCREVDGAARSLIYGAGYSGCFGHGTGHGVGLQIHEAPRLSPMAGDAKLAVGHVVTVEPGIYIEGRYGCRIEDMVAVTPDGKINFTKSTKELIELF